MKNHLTTKQLAERWGMNPVSLSNWRIKGTGPRFIKIGKLVFYPLDEVEAAEKNLRTSTCDPGHTARKSRPRL